MVLTLVKSSINSIMGPFYSMIAKTKVSPDFITLLGFGFAVLAGFGFAFQYYWLAVLGVALTGFLDMLDGGVARANGHSSKQGAFLDSVMDRLGETAIYTGMTLGFTAGIDQLSSIVLLAAAFSVSYLRARGESLGVDMAGIGLMERAERMLFLIMASLGGVILGEVAVVWVVRILVILTLYTVVQRFFKGYFDLGNEKLTEI